MTFPEDFEPVEHPNPREKEWERLNGFFRVFIQHTGTYHKEKWLWIVYSFYDGKPTSVAEGTADSACEAGVLGKYAMFDAIDKLVGFP